MKLAEHQLKKEQISELVIGLEQMGDLAREGSNGRVCKEAAYKCPLCGYGLIVIQTGKSFEIVCKQYGNLVTQRGK